MGRFVYSVTAAALVFAVTACGGGESGGQSADAAATPAAGAQAAGGSSGQAVYARTCQTCHQVHGNGMPGAFPPIAGSEIIVGDKGLLIRLALHGLQGPITVKGQTYNNVMPPWKSLSDAEMAAVLTYVRSNFGNTASAVTPEEVAAERAATAARTQPWTAPELGLH